MFYDTLFSKFHFKYLLSHTHYNTNNIKNYILKSKCNGVSTVIQKILIQKSNKFFYHADVIFTYSDSININRNSSSKINKQISIGSFFMEYYYYTQPSHTKDVMICYAWEEMSIILIVLMTEPKIIEKIILSILIG